MRILLADNQAQVRFALRILLERQSGFEIVGEATSARDLLSEAEAACPDLVLLAWELPGLEAKPVMQTLHKICPQMGVIALSGHIEARRAALDAGADAFVSKSDPPEQLLSAIHGRHRSRTSSPELRIALDDLA